MKSKAFSITAIIIISVAVLSACKPKVDEGSQNYAFAKAQNKNVSPKGFNYAIGTQTVGSKYKFSNETMLVETAKSIKEMGSNLLKFSMHPRYCTENYGLPKNDAITSLKKLAIMEPSIKSVLDMDFSYYHIWTYGFSQYTPETEGSKDDTTQIKFIDGFPEEYEEALYDEIYEFAVYLLNEYNGSGKTFYLGNWEGDWHLRSDYDRNKPANPKTLEGMITWAKTRQKAIDDAKRDTAHDDVEIYHYVEVNLVRKAIEEPDSKVLANSLINVVNPDYVSYSSYDATNPYKSEAEVNKSLKTALSFLQEQLQEKPGLPAGKRVWIGEYGNPSAKYSDEEQNTRSLWTIKTGLEWGTPFILYWEMYNNEINSETGEHIGYWLITDAGKKQPIWHTHNQFYKESNLYLTNYIQTHNDTPSFDQFREAALTFNSLNP